MKSELTISEHSKEINDLIQLKNGNLVSCSCDDKTMNLYQLIENDKYKLLSQIKVKDNYSPMKIRELENGEIGLVANESILFYFIYIKTIHLQRILLLITIKIKLEDITI